MQGKKITLAKPTTAIARVFIKLTSGYNNNHLYYNIIAESCQYTGGGKK